MSMEILGQVGRRYKRIQDINTKVIGLKAEMDSLAEEAETLLKEIEDLSLLNEGVSK